MVLDASDEVAVMDAAECLAESFTGVQVGDAVIQEPMSVVLGISKEVHQEFTLGYLRNVMDQGFCFIAKDQNTQKVMGVLACEIYNPHEEPPVFDGDLASMNEIIDFLVDLDQRFEAAVQQKLGAPIQDNQFVHMFMIGARTEFDKKYIGEELGKMAIRKAAEQGYKAVFGEVTNFRSQKLAELFGFYIPKDVEHQPIRKMYADDEVFHEIPEDIAVCCSLIYLELDPAFALRD